MSRTLILFSLIALLTSGCADSGGVIAPNATDTATADTRTGDTTSADTGSSGADTFTGTDTSAPPDTSGGVDTSPAPDTQLPPGSDDDNDGISNEVEGAPSTDTDGDGLPDFQDPDSDNDGVSDADESGGLNPPVDSDGDGTPDFRDTDSDNNGIDDALESPGDSDADAIPDRRDLDDDGDSAPDLIEIVADAADCDNDGTLDDPGSAADPNDCDGDGTPDFQDIDSDGDGIEDRFEGTVTDTDGDGFLDRYDLDSDNDGILDSRETNIDTDADTIPDYRDPDSDNDGLSDADELANGTDPTLADTDSDGVSDLIEAGAGTNPIDPGDNPRTRGDFVFVVPYQAPPDPLDDTLAFRTNFQKADVYFLIDRSGSMQSEMQAMHDAVVGIVDNLTCATHSSPGTCVDAQGCASGQACSLDGACIDDPATAGCIPSFWTGAGTYSGVYGDGTSDGNAPIQNVQNLGNNPGATTSAIPTSVGKSPAYEVLHMAIECIAGGNNGRCPGSEVTGCSSSGIGCPGYRQDAARVLVVITDEINQDPDTSYTVNAAANALNTSGREISLIGVQAQNEPPFYPICQNNCYGPSNENWNNDGFCDDGGGTNYDYTDCAFGTDCNDCGTRNESQFAPALKALATAAGAVDANGELFVRAGDGTAVVPAVTDAIREVVNDVPIRVTISAADLPGDDGDALPFLDYLSVNTLGADIDADGTVDCETVSPTEDTNADTHDDAFPSLRPGRRVCWDVHPAQNTTVPPTDEPQVFLMELSVSGDGAILDKRTVFFLVPPKPPEIIN